MTKLPDFKVSFPKWEGNRLASEMKKHISKAGIELLQVCFDSIFRCMKWHEFIPI